MTNSQKKQPIITGGLYGDEAAMMAAHYEAEGGSYDDHSQVVEEDHRQINDNLDYVPLDSQTEDQVALYLDPRIVSFLDTIAEDRVEIEEKIKKGELDGSAIHEFLRKRITEESLQLVEQVHEVYTNVHKADIRSILWHFLYIRITPYESVEIWDIIMDVKRDIGNMVSPYYKSEAYIQKVKLATEEDEKRRQEDEKRRQERLRAEENKKEEFRQKIANLLAMDPQEAYRDLNKIAYELARSRITNESYHLLTDIIMHKPHLHIFQSIVRGLAGNRFARESIFKDFFQHVIDFSEREYGSGTLLITEGVTEIFQNMGYTRGQRNYVLKISKNLWAK